MRRYILPFVLCALSLCAFCQEAFYVYRNDGNFNGFFYDEVQSMSYSKFDLDSVEHDMYVVQDIVLEDTIYRIPLSVIDSIGFRQPEIKFNPNVKFMERDGLCQYFAGIDINAFYLKDVPANKMPKYGDVIIGLPSDSIAEQYTASIGNLGSGSFSCVVTKVENKNGSTTVYGHPIENVGDVFEQYITVEEIGVDNQGKIHRRIAGCTPDGMPKRIREASGHKEITLFDVKGTFTDNFKDGIEITTDVTAKLKTRITYDIEPTHFMVCMSRSFTLTTKPSVSISISKDFEGTSDNIIKTPRILFPPACPIFETNPFPALFFRCSGSIGATLHLPKTGMTLSDEIVFDNRNAFPISCTLGFDPIPGNIEGKLIDLSADFSFEGYAQTGLKFSMDVATASWFKRIVRGEVGFYLYAGPKVTGNISLTDAIGSLLNYSIMENSSLQFSFISIDFETKARASIAGKKPEEKTFFHTDKAFFTYNACIAPHFDKTTVVVNEHEVVYKLHPQPDWLLSTITTEIGIFDGEHGLLVKKVGNWEILYHASDAEDAYTFVLPVIELPATTYYVVPIVYCGDFGPYEVWEAATSYEHPFSMEVNTNHLSFGATDNLKQNFLVKTNGLYNNDEKPNINMPSWVDDIQMQNIGTETNEYNVTCTAISAQRFFERSDAGQISMNDATCDISVTKEASDVSNLSISLHTTPVGTGYDLWCDFVTTGVRTENGILISWSGVSGFGHDATINFVIEKTNETTQYGEPVIKICNGSASSSSSSVYYNGCCSSSLYCNVNFDKLPCSVSDSYIHSGGNLIGVFDYTEVCSENEECPKAQDPVHANAFSLSISIDLKGN